MTTQYHKGLLLSFKVWEVWKSDAVTSAPVSVPLAVRVCGCHGDTGRGGKKKKYNRHKLWMQRQRDVCAFIESVSRPPSWPQRRSLHWDSGGGSRNRSLSESLECFLHVTGPSIRQCTSSVFALNSSVNPHRGTVNVSLSSQVLIRSLRVIHSMWADGLMTAWFTIFIYPFVFPTVESHERP